MNERERWIVYPLLFLALGASLRDKIIKTTESQRIKCQGLCVYDSNDQPLLILGAEQFPELRPDAPNLLRVDDIASKRVVADFVAGNKIEGVQFVAPKDRVGELVADQVMAKNYVLTDGKNNLKLDGRYTVPLMRILSLISSQYQASQRAAADAAKRRAASAQRNDAKDSDAKDNGAKDNNVPSNEPPNNKPSAETQPKATAPPADEPEAKAPAASADSSAPAN